MDTINAANRISVILISYEIVWATLRNAPRRAYLEFDLHPAINVVYTFIAEIHRKYKIPNWIQNAVFWCGKILHIINDRNSPIIGAIINEVLLALVGVSCSFKNNLIASANGCGSPMKITLLGPFRSWKYPSNFRSSSV